MVKIKSNFGKRDMIFSTLIKGITLKELKQFEIATRGDLTDFWDENRHHFFVPGVMVIGMFRYVVKKLYNENNNFPIQKLSVFYGSNGGTEENRIFINENLKYNFVLRSSLNDGYLFEVEIIREETNEIVLHGLFQFK